MAEKQGYHYSSKTLKMANHRFGSKSEALNGVIDYFNENFAGIDIPKNCIRTAFDKCFNVACNQDELNRDVKNYLLKNLARM